MKYYLYRHIRLDTNKPFYIGIGTKGNNYNTIRSEYKRAYQKWGRNQHWKRVVKKVDYVIEILFESDEYNEIKQKEIELIKLYPDLVNYTQGGQGTLGLNGKKHPKSKKVYQYSKEGFFIKKWDSINLAGEKLEIHTTNIVSCLKGKLKSIKGFRWSYKKKNKLEPLINLSGKFQKTKKKVYKIDIITGDILQIFDCINDAAKSVNIHAGKISQCCNNKRKTCRNFKWKFYEK